MSRSGGLIILILAFALSIQNTCPHGFAGKTSLGSSLTHHASACCRLAAPDNHKIISKSHEVSGHFPLFLFSMPDTIHASRLCPTTTAEPFLAGSYKDPLPAEHLRPPLA